MKRNLILILVLSGLVLGACQNFTRSREAAYVERPVEALYSSAMSELDQRDYTEAVLLFNEVDRQHPYSEWARRAMLMSAFASYRTRSYEDTIQTAERYIALHPGTYGAAYAYYLVGISHFEQIVDIGREQRATELAKVALEEVVRRFPQSDYARDAELKLDMVNDQLAGKEMAIGRWYLRKDQHLPAINRFRNVILNYETTSHTAEALHRLVEAYLSVGLEQQALESGSVLFHNYPQSVWYKDTYALLIKTGVVQPEAQN